MTLGSPSICAEPRGIGLTHIGLVRTENEDAFGMEPEQGLWIVADGMGGHANGRLVADRAVSAVCRLELPADLAVAMEQTKRMLEKVNHEVWQCSQAWRQTMGATVVVALLRGERLGLLWAGDSRCYRMRRGHLDRLTRDHTVVQRLIDQGEISEFDVPTHPMRNVVTRGVGVSESLKLDAEIVPVCSDDVILLCTDGLHNTIEDRDIAAQLRYRNGQSAQHLIDATLASGARDNVTVLTIQL